MILKNFNGQKKKKKKKKKKIVTIEILLYKK